MENGEGKRRGGIETGLLMGGEGEETPGSMSGVRRHVIWQCDQPRAMAAALEDNKAKVVKQVLFGRRRKEVKERGACQLLETWATRGNEERFSNFFVVDLNLNQCFESKSKIF
jgi:hypothetical protein